MKKYGVYVPVAGYIYKEVEAESKEEALDKVFDEGYEDDDIQEMDMYDIVVEGNVCHLNTSRAYAEEIED
ncbi:MULTISPECIES: hypothetical protein [unclassified Clostridium]|uniref:hypothetical protein n=1 Tax=unclassified Clostridium TaxID=2614128 RepID=UPI0025B888DF|nr:MULTISPECIES: hypothetical protein [unclassified Clostridium]